MTYDPAMMISFRTPASLRKLVNIAFVASAKLSFLAFGAAAASLLLAGCAGMVSPSAGGQSVGAMSGSVHGGQQPVAGATVSLIAPGTTGYGIAGSVIASTTTDVQGNFTLPRPYTCPTNSNLVYLLATGGNAGGGTNSAIAEAAIAGPCSSLTANNYFSISEVTTVAAAYALAPFATVAAGSANIGTSATNLQGLTNAAGAANNLANVATGTAHVTGDFPGIVPPTSELNTIADILSTCVNQGTTLGGSTSCATLFANTTPGGGVAPTDTFQAAINLAKNPSLNNATLFGLVTPNGPFQPTLTSAPGDFTVALGYNGGAITPAGGAIGVNIDAVGNAWITTSGNAAHCLTEISPTGVYLSGSTVSASTGFGCSSLTSAIGIAIDQSGFIDVANNGANTIVKFNPNGTVNSTFSATSISGPNGITIDGAGDIWVANFNATLNKTTELLPAGVESTHSPVTTGLGNVDVAAGPLAVWETNYQNNFISRIDLTTFAVIDVNIGGTQGGVAIDHNNNAWIAVTGNGNVFESNNAGTLLNPFGGYVYVNGSVQNIAVDGLGNIFCGGYLNPTSMGALVEFNNSGTNLGPANGFYGSGVIPNAPQPPEGIAIDGSGNVWIAGSTQGTLPAYVAQIVGIAAPVVTPRSTAVTNNTLGLRP